MPLKCTYRRNTGPRPWDSRKLRDLVCALVKKGRASEEAICDAIEECVECGDREKKCEKERQRVQQLAGALLAAQAEIETAIAVFGAITAAIAVVAKVARFVPQARPLATALQFADSRAIATLAQMEAVSLANQAILRAMRGSAIVRAAARVN